MKFLRVFAWLFEQYEGAVAFNDEIHRLQRIWTDEAVRLEREAREGRRTLTRDERWALVGEMPECKEHSRLAKLQEPFDGRMEALIKQRWQLPARTAEGRRAKTMVLLFCVLGPDWQQSDAETDYAERHARTLLICRR